MLFSFPRPLAPLAWADIETLRRGWLKLRIDNMKTLTIEIVDREMAIVLANKSESQRLRIAWGMWRSARQMLTRMLTDQHVDWTPQQIQAEVSRRLASGT